MHPKEAEIDELARSIRLLEPDHQAYRWTGLHDGKSLASAATYKLLDLEPFSTELTESMYLNFIHPEDRAHFISSRETLLGGKHPVIVEYHITSATGIRKSIRELMQFIPSHPGPGMMSSLKEQSVQHDGTRSVLHKSGDGNDFYPGMSPDMISRWSSGLNMIYANETFGAALSSMGNIIYKEDTGPLARELSESWLQRLRLLRETGTQMNHFDSVLSSRPAAYFFTQLIPEFNGQGELQSILAITRNITESKKRQLELDKMNESLKHKNRQLEQHNKELVSLGKVTSDELQAPLKRIYTSIELLIGLEGNKLSDTGKAHFRRIQSAVQKMGLITDDLLSFVQLGNPDLDLNMQRLDLNRILEEAIRGLDKKIRKANARINATVALPCVTGNQFLLIWLFQQLLLNAIKFQPPGQTPEIEISTETIIKTDTDRHTILKEWLKVSFTDNGIGFNEADKSKLFQLFSKLPGHEQFKGSGIGLAICRKIMERHEGTIHGESKGVQGSTFYCCFPPVIDYTDADPSASISSAGSLLV